jgi:hypothetical protein
MAIAVGRRGILPPTNRPLVVVDGIPILCDQINTWTEPQERQEYGSAVARPIKKGGVIAIARNGREYHIKTVMTGIRDSGRAVYYLSTQAGE